MFACRRDGSGKVFLDDEAADGDAEGGAESGILDVYAYRNFGMVVWRKSDEGAVVLAVRILCRAGLSGHLDAGNSSATAGASGDGHAHSFGYVAVIARLNGGTAHAQQLFIHNSVAYRLDYVRGYEPSAIGDGGAKVGNLHGSGADFALTDRHGDYCVGTPMPLAIYLVVETIVGDKSSAFAGQVYTETVSVAHTYEVLLPHLKGICCIAVLAAAVNHSFEAIAEEGIARGLQSRFQRQWACMAVASDAKSSADISMVAWVGGGGGDNAFL